MVHYFTLWPWPFAFDVEHLQRIACDVMKLCTKFECYQRSSYYVFNIWPNDIERRVTCCVHLWFVVTRVKLKLCTFVFHYVEVCLHYIQWFCIMALAKDRLDRRRRGQPETFRCSAVPPVVRGTGIWLDDLVVMAYLWQSKTTTPTPRTPQITLKVWTTKHHAAFIR